MTEEQQRVGENGRKSRYGNHSSAAVRRWRRDILPPAFHSFNAYNRALLEQKSMQQLSMCVTFEGHKSFSPFLCVSYLIVYSISQEINKEQDVFYRHHSRRSTHDIPNENQFERQGLSHALACMNVSQMRTNFGLHEICIGMKIMKTKGLEAFPIVNKGQLQILFFNFLTLQSFWKQVAMLLIFWEVA